MALIYLGSLLLLSKQYKVIGLACLVLLSFIGMFTGNMILSSIFFHLLIAAYLKSFKEVALIYLIWDFMVT